jgi:hypothetical protein
MTSTISKAGYVPFVDGVKDASDEENEVLKSVEIVIWPCALYRNGAEADCIVGVDTFFCDEAVGATVNLIDLIRPNFKGNVCGPKAEAVAIRSLICELLKIVSDLDKQT